MGRVQQCVQAVRERQQQEWLWQCISTGMMIGGGLACLAGFVRLTSAGLVSWAWVVAPLLGGPAGGAVFALWKPRSIRGAAAAIDRTCGLKDRVETAIAFLAGPESDDLSGLRRLQIADAEQHVNSVDPVTVVPINGPRWWPLALTLSAAAILLLFLSATEETLQAAVRGNVVVAAQATRAESELDELKEFARNQPDPEVEKLVRELSEKIEQLKQPGLDPREALAKLSEMEASLQQMQQKLSEAGAEAALQEIGNALSLADAMAAAGQAMSRGDMEKAERALSELDLPQLDRKTEKAITEKLEQVQQNSGAAAAGKSLKDAVSQISQSLSKGDRSQFRDGAKGLAGECRKQGLRKKLSDLLRKQCQCLGECKSECERECRSPSDKVGKGGRKAGQGASGNEPGAKTDKLKSSQKLQLTGQDSGEGEVETETTTAPEQEQDAVRQYRQNVQKYEALSESVLESESVPLGHRQTIRRYFELIRPNDAETDKVKQQTSPEQ